MVRQAPSQEVDVDMTPLIDVTFLLLIFFMVISVFNHMERAAELDLPSVVQAMVQKDVAEDRMVVNIEKDGSIVLFNQDVTLDAFRDQLHRIGPALRMLGGKGEEAPLVIRGDRDCPFEHVRHILAAVYEENITKVMFAAYEKKPSEETR